LEKGQASLIDGAVERLCAELAAFGSVPLVRAFLEDLCTPAEILAMADRWRVAQLLDEGLPYRQIYEKTGVSTATVTRVARSLALGAGGYRAALARGTKRAARAKGNAQANTKTLKRAKPKEKEGSRT
jgi:TrpR-related protein YerC/YecD